MKIDYLNNKTGSSGGSWATEYEVDFTAEPDHDFIVDTTQDIQGVTWTAANESNADTLEVQNGTGLVLEPKSATDWINATKTAPYLSAAVTNFMDSFAIGDNIRILIEFSGNITANYDAVFVSYMNSTIRDGFEARRGYNGGQIMSCSRWQSNSRNFYNASSTDTVIGVEVKRQDGNTFSGGSSAFENSDLAGVDCHMGVAKQPADAAIFTASTDLMILGALRASSGTTLSIVITGFKVQRFT